MPGKRLAAILALALLVFGSIVAVPTGSSSREFLASLMVRAPIHIMGDGDFTGANGVVGGQGTVVDPYVIAGWNITAEFDPGVWIQDTRAAFVVRDVSVQCYYAGIDGMRLANVTDASLQNVTVRQCDSGANVANASRMSISASHFVPRSAQGTYGIQATGSDNLTVEDSNVTAGMSLGFFGDQNLTVQRNYLVGYLQIQHARDAFLGSNELAGGAYIYVVDETGIQLLGNDVTLGGISAWRTSNLTMSGNRIGSIGFYPDCSAGRCETYNVTDDNLVGGKPLLFYRRASRVTVDGALVGEVILVNTTGARVRNLSFDRGGPSVVVAGGDDFELTNVSAVAGALASVSLYDVRNATVTALSSLEVDMYGVEDTTVDRVVSGTWLLVESSDTFSVVGSAFGAVTVEASSNFSVDGNVFDLTVQVDSSTNFSVNNNTIGGPLWAYGSSNFSVGGNVVAGIYLSTAAKASLRSNEVTGLFRGIGIDGSREVAVQDNNITGNGSYLKVDSSSYVELSRNRIGDGGAYLCTDTSSCETYNVTPDNLVNGRPLRFYRDCANLTVDGIDIGELIILNCTHVRAANLTFGSWAPQITYHYSYPPPALIVTRVTGLEVANLSSTGPGVGRVILSDVHNASVTGLRNGTGILVDGSSHLSLLDNRFLQVAHYDNTFSSTSDVVFRSNVVEGNSTYGSWVWILGSGANFTVTSNEFNWTHVWFRAVSNVTLERNAFGRGYLELGPGQHYLVANNSLTGGWSLSKLDDTLLLDNVLLYGGIFVEDSRGAVATGNLVWGDALRLFNVTGWTLYNNTFTGPAYDDRGAENRWDDGYPTGGNLWLDYKGVDNCRGPSQDDCTAGDGFGDTPYVIYDNGTDRYPIMPPPTPPPPPGPPPPENLPPVASITAYPTTAVVGQNITFVGTDSYDPDGQAIFLLYRWDFGDGTTSAKDVALHSYSVVGHYTVTLTVWDLYDATGTATVNIAVVVASPPPAIQLLSFQIWDGYRIPLPLGWSLQFNATVGNRTYDVYLEGRYNDTPVTLAADSEVEAGIQEARSTVQTFADRVLAAARSTDPDARFLADPDYRTLSNHAGVVFTVVYAHRSVFQEFAYVVSGVSGRSWLIFLSGSLADVAYLTTLFERIVAGFTITLIEVAPPDLGWVLLVAGVTGAAVAPIVAMAYVQWRRRRS